jgi:hypothetical protein
MIDFYKNIIYLRLSVVIEEIIRVYVPISDTR